MTIRNSQVCICAVAIIATVIASSCGREIPECSPPAGFTKITLPGGLPPALQQEVKMKLPPGLSQELREKLERIDVVAAPGESIDTSGRRYMFAWNRDVRWIIAIEQTGGVYTHRVSAYELSKDRKSAREIKMEFADVNSGAVCAVATRIANE